MKKAFLVLLPTLLLTSCDLSSLPFFSFVQSSDSDTSKSSSSAVNPSSSSGVGSASSNNSAPSSSDIILPPQEDIYALFDQSKSLSVELRMSDDAMRFISERQNNRGKYADFYVPGDLYINYDGQQYVYNEVGVRQKGNMSRRAFYHDGRPQELIHFKVSFKATFDDDLYNDPAVVQFKKTWDSSGERKARKKRNFMGFEKLDFKYIPRNNNQSFAREIYSYKMFEEAGLYAPKTRACTFSFGSAEHQLSSTYQIIENIDKDFITRRLGDTQNKGDLYKCVYNSMGKADFTRDNAIEKTYDNDGNSIGGRIAHGKIGVEDDYNEYFPCYQLKTNDSNGEDSDFSKMANLMNVLWNVRYHNAPKSDIDAIIDTDQFLKFSAVSYLLCNFDDQRYDNNNFYIYFMPSSNKAIFIPYDWDWSLGLGSEHSFIHKMPLDSETLGGEQANSLFMNTFLSGDQTYATPYLNYVQQYKNMVYDMDAFLEVANAICGVRDDQNQIQNFFSTRLNMLQ